jgi:hypothetical protein
VLLCAPRGQSMKRWPIKLGVFVLAGAIVNVAVAWGCVLLAPITVCDPTRADEATLWRKELANGNKRLTVDRATGLGRSDILLDDPGLDDQPAFRSGAMATLRRAGWPLRCFEGKRITSDPSALWGPANVPYRFTTALPIPAWAERKHHFAYFPPDKYVFEPTFLPIGIMPVPFVGNVLFYVLSLVLMTFGSGAMKRIVRGRRGLCPACAYPVGRGGTCTECGKELKQKAETQKTESTA